MSPNKLSKLIRQKQVLIERVEDRRRAACDALVKPLFDMFGAELVYQRVLSIIRDFHNMADVDLITVGLNDVEYNEDEQERLGSLLFPLIEHFGMSTVLVAMSDHVTDERLNTLYEIANKLDDYQMWTSRKTA